MARFKTFVNGGAILPGDVNTIEDDYECAFSTYKSLFKGSYNETVINSPPSGPGSGAAGTYAIGEVWLDPARYSTIASTWEENPRSVYYNLGASLVTNSTSPGTVTFTVGLAPITSTDGTFAANVTGSTAVFTNPAASTIEAAVYSGDFIAPTAGLYVVTLTLSANMAGSSGATVYVDLQMRQV